MNITVTTHLDWYSKVVASVPDALKMNPRAVIEQLQMGESDGIVYKDNVDDPGSSPFSPVISSLLFSFGRDIFHLSLAFVRLKMSLIEVKSQVPSVTSLSKDG